MAVPRILGRGLRRFLVSLNTASVFLLILTLCAGVAGWLPQFPREEAGTLADVQWWWNALRGRYTAVIFYPLKALGFFGFFWSPLFLALMLVILVSALLCTWNRLPGVLRAPSLDNGLVTEPGFYTSGPLTLNLPADMTPALVRALKRRGYRVSSREDGGQMCFYAEKNRLARLGSLVAHLSLLLIVGGLVLSLVERTQFTTPPLVPGSTFSVGGQELMLAEFKLDRSPQGLPTSYRSRVRMRSGRELPIEMGHPALIGGYLVLFNSYGPAWTVEAFLEGGEPATMAVDGEEHRGRATVPFPAMGEVRRLELVDTGAVLELGIQPEGLFVEVYREGERLFQGLVEAGREYRLARVQIGFTPAHYVKYRVVRDPGFPLALGGFAVFALGTLVVSSFPYRRIWGLTDGETCRIKGGRGFSSHEWQKLFSEF